MRALSIAVVAVVSTAILTGCQRTEEIQTYTVPKAPVPPIVAAAAEQPSSQPPAAEPAEPTDRMLAAVLPAGGRAWFFKVTGPIPAVDRQAETIDQFFKSVRLQPGAAKPEWKLPDGWTERPGTGMRAATIMIPADETPLEMSVIALPWRGAPGEMLSNINRWRGQMKLQDVRQSELGEFTREIMVGDATMTIVDLRGQFSAGNMAAPFAGGGPFSGGAAPNRGAASPSATENPRAPRTDPGLPEGHPPIDAQRAAQAVPLTFKAPESWQPLRATGMHKAAFEIKQGAQNALVTVIDFSADAGPLMADPLENINRWRREVGLAPINKDALEDAVEEIKVARHTGQYVEMIPDTAKPAASQADRATLGAIVPVADRIWFFKLTGDRDLVAGQRDNFESFLESIRFTADDGT